MKKLFAYYSPNWPGIIALLAGESSHMQLLLMRLTFHGQPHNYLPESVKLKYAKEGETCIIKGFEQPKPA